VDLISILTSPLFPWMLSALFGAALYIKGRIDRGVADALAATQRELHIERANSAKKDAALKADAVKQMQDAALLASMDAKIKALTDAIKNGDSVVLDADDTDGLRKL
jgi:hypothetical protein